MFNARWFIPLAVISASAVSFGAEQPGYSFANAQAFLKTYCQACHGGAASSGGFRLERFATPASLQSEAQKWSRASLRVHNGEMPPQGAPAPNVDAREQFSQWVGAALRADACPNGATPGPYPIRRLNREEYTATVEHLLDMHLDIGHALPADGAGGEGFDNAAETLFLSPLHSEKYMDAAKMAMDFASKEFKTRARILVAKPGPGMSADQAAREVLKAFLPRAFRRPVNESDIQPYLELFQAAQKQGQEFEPAIFFALRGVLVSPLFLYRAEPPNTTSEARPLDQYALASRLSYFLWGSMPDELLFDLAEDGRLQDPAVLKELVGRMLRSEKSIVFCDRFVGQWLRTRELNANKKPDQVLFPTYYGNEELRSDIAYQPVLFFRELLLRNLSLLNLIESNFTIETTQLSRLYGERPLQQVNQQPKWLELPDTSHRGGLLGMAAVLVVSSHPYRTSPVLRGAWILDSLLGTPPPPPPPNVPPLPDQKEGAAPASVRERLTQHRENPVCASCHARIDPLGFALENFDAIGRWRTEDGGKMVDNQGQLADGTRFQGPAGLKAALLERKDLVIRNLTNKMLGYALGRGLTLKDSCTVDSIVAQVKDNNYSARSLVEAIVLSVPFRYQAAAKSIQKEEKKP